MSDMPLPTEILALLNHCEQWDYDIQAQSSEKKMVAAHKSSTLSIRG